MPISTKAQSGDVRTAEQAIRDCLSGAPFVRIEQVQVEPREYSGRPDLLVRVSLPDGDIVLVVEIKKSGQPRVAKEAAGQLARTVRTLPRAYGIFVAPYISPATMSLCAEMDIGCIDFAGNCRLSFWPIFIERKGNPNPFATRRELRSLYSPRASRVIRVLLADPCRSWKMIELSKEADVSIGMAANVKSMLADREWITTGENGFRLSNPQALIEDWVGNYDIAGNQIAEFYSLDPVSVVETRIADVCSQRGIIYALTGFSGAARLAPHVRYERVMSYVDGNALDDIAAELTLKPVTSGANVSLMIPYDEGVVYGAREIDGVCVASPVQVYLDLLSLRGRGEEAAQAILREVIQPQWR